MNRKFRIPYVTTYIHYSKIFYQFIGIRLFFFATLSGFVTLLEGVGISIFLPLFSILSTGSNVQQDSGYIGATLSKALGQTPTLTQTMMVVVMLFVAKGTFHYWAGKYQSKISTEFIAKLRKDMVLLYSKADYKHISQFHSGFLANLFSNEITKCLSSFSAIANQMSHIITIIVFGVILLYTDIGTTFTLALLGGVFLMLFRVLSRLSHEYSHQQTQQNGLLSSMFVQVFQSSKYLFATQTFPRLEQRIFSHIEHLRQIDYKSQTLTALSTATAQPMSVIILVFVMFIEIVILGKPMSAIVVVLMFVFRINNEIVAFQQKWQYFNQSVGGVDIVVDTMNALRKNTSSAYGVEYKGFEREILFNDVSFGYNAQNRVVKNLSIRIPKNATIALVGSSGAGKSTIVDLLTGLYEPVEGSVCIDDVNEKHISMRDFRSQIGYVTQDSMLFDASVIDNISLWDSAVSDEIRRDKAITVARKAKCIEFIDSMEHGWNTVIGERGTRLSGGQRQRLAIARELYKEPEILILDEATSALDGESELYIQESIRELKGETTVIVIAHRLSTIRHADVIFVLDQGAIVEQGSFDELTSQKNGKFYMMCKQQNILT